MKEVVTTKYRKETRLSHIILAALSTVNSSRTAAIERILYSSELERTKSFHAGIWASRASSKVQQQIWSVRLTTLTVSLEGEQSHQELQFFSRLKLLALSHKSKLQRLHEFIHHLLFKST